MIRALVPYALAALIGVAGVWYVAGLRADLAALTRDNTRLTANAVALQGALEQARDARRVADAALARETARAAEIDTIRDAFRKGEFDALPPDFRDLVLDLLRPRPGR